MVPLCIDKYFFDVDEDGKGLKSSIILLYDFYKADWANQHHLHPGTELTMREMCSQVHRDEESSIIGVMSENTSVGPFPWKVETNI